MYSDAKKLSAWELAEICPQFGMDPAKMRIVAHGVTIKWDCFQKHGDFGWTIKDGQPVPFRPLTLPQVAALLARRRSRDEHGT